MISTAELVSAAMRSKGLTSVAALARELGIPEKTVYRWSRGENFPEDEGAARLAAAAGLDAGEVLASIRAERATEPAMRSLWLSIAERLHAASVAALAVILSLWIGGGPDGAAVAATPGDAASHATVDSAKTPYTLSRVAAWLAAWVRGFSLRRAAPMVRACCT